MLTDSFEPARFSVEELTFILEHLEESPTVALHGGVPRGVHPEAVKAALGRFVELQELSKVKKVAWCGYEPIKDSIERFIAFQEKCREGQSYGEPRHPSMMTWDSTGAAARGGVGSDASDMVRTELLPDGSRRPFVVKLVNSQQRSKMWGRQEPINTTLDKIADNGDGTFTCTICEKVVANYEVDRGTRARNRALKAARDHCRSVKKEHARHRAILNVPIG